MNGTKIQFQNYSILMTPLTTASSQSTYHSDDQTVKYDGVFGTNTAIVYQTELNGLKEDIVLYQNVGKNSFDFDLRLTNLTPIQTNGTWYLKNSEGQMIASFGRIIIKDSAGSTVEGSMTIIPAVGKGQYRATVIAPETFINDSSTVYPVYVDPSTYIWEEDWYYYYDDEYGYEYSESYDAITDTGLYTTASGVTSANMDQEHHTVGYTPSASGKVIYKLYDFFGEHGQYKNLQDNQIGTAHLYINVNNGPTATFTVNPMTATWENSSVGENPIALTDSTLWNAYSGNYAYSINVDSNPGVRAIDITEILRGWARYNAGTSANAYDNPANGFVLSSSATTSARNVTAVEEFYADSVYVLMDTSFIGGSYYVNNVTTGQFLRRSTNTTLTTSQYSDISDIRWYFEYLGNDKYYIRSMYNQNYVLYGSNSSVSLAYLPNNPSEQYIWDVRTSAVGGVIIKNAYSGRVLKYDGTSLSLVAPLSSSNANYRQTVWGILAESNYVNLTDFELSDDWLLPGSSKYFNIRETAGASWATNSCFNWSILSNNGSASKNVFTVTSDGKVSASQYGGTATLTVTHKMTGLSKTFRIASGAVREGTYMIMNKGTGRYMDVKGPSKESGALIHQWDYHTDPQAKWKLTILPGGSYTIQSEYSQKWLKAGSTTDTNEIIQYSHYGTPSAKWYITETTSGNYKISPSNAETYAIRVPLNANSNGTSLERALYTNDSNYRDEWIISEVDFTLYAISNVGHDHLSALQYAQEVLSNDGKQFITLKSGAVLAETCKTDLKETYFFASRSHGALVVYSGTDDPSTTGILLNDGSGDSRIILYGHSWSGLNSNSTYFMETDSFNLTGLAVFIGCNTAYGGAQERNIVNAIVQKGANAAIGFEDSIGCNAANSWTEMFFDELISGKTIDEAIDFLNSQFGISTGLRSAVICGNTNFRL